MVMSWIFSMMIFASVIFALLSGNGTVLAAATAEGAQAGITLAVSMAGSLCLWTGVGALMEKAGLTAIVSRLLRPVLGKLFPSSRTDPHLEDALSANICANLFGLGNAATPMGITAAKRLRKDHVATDELCRLVVLNTASIQLIPTNVAAVRSALGAEAPFSILGAVWISSICSAGLGVALAALLGRIMKR